MACPQAGRRVTSSDDINRRSRANSDRDASHTRDAAAAAIDVFRFLAALKSRENVFRIEPGDRHFTLFLNLCVDLKLRGNDVNDAHLVALALENNATLVTADRGFGRFSGLRVFDPLEGPKP